MLPAMAWRVLTPGFVVVALFVACQTPQAPDESADPPLPNFVIIDIDSLRADLLEATRDGAPIAPAIHSLAQRGVRFDDAFSQSSWTFPALASLLTGRYPPSFATMNPKGQQLAELGTTLPDVLALYGYHTAVAWGDTAPVTYPAFSQGFQQRIGGPGSGPPSASTRHVVDFLAQPPHEPFLMLLHDMDLHRPVPPPPAEIVRRHLEDDPPPRCTSLNETYKRNRETLDEASARRQVAGCYHAALEAYDTEVAALLDQLERSGLADHTVVILTSNHGEGLFEHGALGHAELQYDTVLRVPLVILDPAQPRPVLRSERVQLVDLVPTILARAGVPPPHDLVGASLLPSLGLAEGEYVERDIYGFANPDHATLRTANHKLHHRLEQGQIVRQLFDLHDDPGEQRDILDSEPELAAELIARLDAFIEQRTAQGQATPMTPGDPFLERELRERGYWEMVRERDGP